MEISGEPLSREETRQFDAPPHNDEAEIALLGALLVNNDAYFRVSDFLRSEHFFYPIHGRVYHHIGTLIGRGQIANPPTLKPYFDADEALREVGGSKYLVKLARSVVTIVNSRDYASSIVDCWRRRKLLDLAFDIEDSARAPSLDVSSNDIAQAADSQLYEIMAEHQHGAGPVDAQHGVHAALTAMDDARKSGGKMLGVPTGIPSLDTLLGGLVDTHLIVLAGRPSMGKSLAANGIGVNVARHFQRVAAETGAKPRIVAYFGLEMRYVDEWQRALSREAQINIKRIQRGQVAPAEMNHLDQVATALAQLPLHIDETPSLTLAEIRSRSRRLARTAGPIGMIVVDHIGLVRPPPELVGHGDTEKVTHTSGGLKALAKDFNCPVLALSQLSRDIERREDKRPMLADLRQSGSIEQDADVVIMAYREHYYLSRSDPIRGPRETEGSFEGRKSDHESRLDATRGRIDLIVPKQRMGEIGSIDCHYDGAFCTVGAPPSREMELGDFRGMEPL